jgi:hypothetical protein
MSNNYRNRKQDRQPLWEQTDDISKGNRQTLDNPLIWGNNVITRDDRQPLIWGTKRSKMLHDKDYSKDL